MNDFPHIPEPYTSAHKVCFRNRDAVMQSKQCGCFYCLSIFPPTEVTEWIKEDNDAYTARCTKCGIDSVIPDAFGFPLDAVFLATMKKWWF